MQGPFYDQEKETLDRPTLERVQIERARAVIERALKPSVCYQRKFREAGLKSADEIARSGSDGGVGGGR